uniref:hypothetical protein n=1 Tax=Agathobacter sp. TaxID=2021311 RepID=UPI004055FB16
MENREHQYTKTPFYMAYPMQNMYMAEMEYEKDVERMKERYPKEVRTIQKMVEKRCDELEYEGSRMYDETPDRFMMEEEALRIYEDILVAQHRRRCDHPWLCSLVRVLFDQEVYRRRCRHRRCRRWW